MPRSTPTVALDPVPVSDVEIPPLEVETFVCRSCEEVFDEDERNRTMVDGSVCNGCVESYSTCYHCSELIHNDNLYEVSSGNLVCVGCRDERYFYCDQCDTYMLDRYLSSDGENCTDCYTPEPEEEDEEDEDAEVVPDRPVVYAPPTHDPLDARNLANRNPERNREEREREIPGVVQSYNFDATGTLPFMGHEKSSRRMQELYLGVELECEVKVGRRNDAAVATAEMLKDFAMLKHDGSIDYGFEIVTAPASFDVHKENWVKFFDKRGQHPATRGLRSFDTNTCGMHVHASRAAMTPLQVSKLLVFINDPQNLNFVETIAQRKQCNWSKYSPKKITEAHQITKEALFEKTDSCPSCGATEKFMTVNGAWICDNNGCCQSAMFKPILDGAGKPIIKLQIKGTHPVMGDKYEALNLKHKNTIEFRIFKGTLNRQSFFKNLEFVHALISYTQNVSISSTDLKAAPFMEWLRKNGTKLYPNLIGFLESKGLMTTAVKTTKRYPKGKTTENVFNNSEAV